MSKTYQGIGLKCAKVIWSQKPIKAISTNIYLGLEKLRVVQTQAILFLKSMSERGGSDRERL